MVQMPEFTINIDTTAFYKSLSELEKAMKRVTKSFAPFQAKVENEVRLDKQWRQWQQDDIWAKWCKDSDDE